MTDRERFNRQMHFEPVDRCFNCEFGYWNENFRRWSIFRQHGITNNSDAHRLFNFDRMEAVGGPVGLNPPFEQVVVRETADKKVVRNSEGLLGEVPKDGHDTIPHYTESSIKTPDDWQQVKAQRYRRDDPVRRVDVDELRRRHPPDREYPLAVHTGSMIGRVRNLLTFEGLAYATYDYPDMVEDMVETQCVLVEDFLDQVLGKIDFDCAAGWEDISFKSGPLVSVPFFRDVVVPRYKRIGERLHAHGIDVWYIDSDGDIRPLIPLFLEAGVNCMFPWEVNSSGPVGPVLDQYGRDLLVMGGVDKMQLGKGREAIRAELESLAPYVERGGFIPHCDHRCPPNVDENDYLFYLDLKEQMFGLQE